MENNLTFTMIKPCAFSNGLAGKILDMILSAGFEVVAMKKTVLSADEAAAFYAIHKGKPFYENLVAFMSSGPIVAIVLRKANAVSEFRTLIGATNPVDAAEGTIRKSYAESLSRNAVHGSDSDENARLEASFFFSQRELL